MNQIKLSTDNIIKTVFPVAIAVCFVTAYWSVFQKLGVHWAKEDNSYCYLIVPLFFYLCWERKTSFHFHELTLTPSGIFLMLVSVSLIMVGELGSVETFLYTGIWGCAASLTVTLYGPRTRFLIFPLIILFFIVPLPPFVNQMLTFKLRIAASILATGMFRMAGVPVFREGNILDIGIDKLQVADACSGLRYLMPMILMAILMGYFFNKGWCRKTVLLLLVPPLSVFVNGFRVFASGLLIINNHKNLTEGFYHDFSGWLVFMVAGAYAGYNGFAFEESQGEFCRKT